MSDVPPEEEVADKAIDIRVTNANVSYTSDLGLPEIVFWIDVVKAMIMKQLISEEEGI